MRRGTGAYSRPFRMAPPAPESRLRPGAGGKAAAWDPRSFAQAPAGASCRTISAVRRRRARNRGPRGRLRGRRRREPPGNRSQAQNLFLRRERIFRRRRERRRPNDQAGENQPSRPGARSQPQARHEPRAARANGRGYPRMGVGPQKQRNRRGRAAPARRHFLPGMSRHRATGRPSPGRSGRAGEHISAKRQSAKQPTSCFPAERSAEAGRPSRAGPQPGPAAAAARGGTGPGRDCCLLLHLYPFSKIRQTQAALSGASSCSAFSV